jgi:hypothetical protein
MARLRLERMEERDVLPLLVQATKPLKPASAIFTRNDRVSQIYLAQKFVD